MKNSLFFDFNVNKENKSIQITREFDAGIELVWKAWTTAELLDQWWGPEPYRAETKRLDFREGGSWLYAMVGPEGQKSWARADFTSIIPEKFFATKDGFSDENGVLNPELPQGVWENKFVPVDHKVRVEMLLVYDNLSDLEKNLEMGFEEGMTIDFQQLDRLLLQLKG